MASVFKLKHPNGTKSYYGSVYIDGKRYRKKLSDTKHTAIKLLRQYEHELLLKPTLTPNPSISLIKAQISFLKDIELTSNIHYKYFAVIKSTLARFRLYCKNKAVEEVAVEDAKEYFHHRCKDRVTNKYKCNLDNYLPRVSPKTVNNELLILKRFFTYCMDMKWIESNPCRRIKALHIPIKERYYFTQDDLKMIFDKAGIYKPFYEVLLHTGIRPTDAFKLAKKHFNGRYMTIRMNKTKLMLSIPITEAIMSTLKVLLEDCSADSSLLFPTFQSDRQRKYCVKHLQSNFTHDFVRKNNINLHTFRHTYAHNMLNKGVPKEVLQTLLGHRSIKTTEIYANWIRKEELERQV